MALTVLTRQTTEMAFPPAVGFPKVGAPRIVVAPDRRCLAADGVGEPGGRAFEAAMRAVYGVAYGLHYLLRDRGVEAHVPPVEALWIRLDGAQDWAEGPVAFDPNAWRWTLLMPLPDEASDEEIDLARTAARRRAKEPVPAVEIRLISEGLVVEAMHVGPYSTEPATIAAMHGLAAAFGLAPVGPHHEIYLGDPRRARPENLRTVLRQSLG